MISIIFYILAGTIIFFSLKVVTTENLFHSVVSAFAVLMSTAGLFFMLNAEFLGIVQILIYAGAITILVLFVVMLTTAGAEYKVTWEKKPSIWAYIALVLFGGMLTFIVLSIQWPTARPVSMTKVTEAMATRLFTDYILPFELASILLLVALVGAIVLARRD